MVKQEARRFEPFTSLELWETLKLIEQGHNTISKIQKALGSAKRSTISVRVASLENSNLIVSKPRINHETKKIDRRFKEYSVDYNLLFGFFLKATLEQHNKSLLQKEIPLLKELGYSTFKDFIMSARSTNILVPFFETFLKQCFEDKKFHFFQQTNLFFMYGFQIFFLKSILCKPEIKSKFSDLQIKHLALLDMFFYEITIQQDSTAKWLKRLTDLEAIYKQP